jgi:hypothetical protein
MQKIRLSHEQEEQFQWFKRFKGSLFDLAKYALNYNDVNQRTHGSLIQTLESASTRKLIVMPRGSLKSSLACVAYPVFLLLNNPNLRILLDSELYTNSTTFLREIKGHLQNPILTHLFGDFKSSTWNESEIIIKQRTRNLKEASITCSGIGATKIGQHYDVCIMDDMNSPSNTANPDQAKKVIDHYRMQTSILEPGGTIVIIGTRYSELDLIAHILEHEVKPEQELII